MYGNDIHDRADLAKELADVGQTTIYRSFDERWAGKATTRMLCAFSRRFGLSLPELVAALVVDPRGRRTKPLRTKGKGVA